MAGHTLEWEMENQIHFNLGYRVVLTSSSIFKSSGDKVYNCLIVSAKEKCSYILGSVLPWSHMMADGKINSYAHYAKKVKIWQLVVVRLGYDMETAPTGWRRILWLQVWEKQLNMLDVILFFLSLSLFGSSYRNLILRSSTPWILQRQPPRRGTGQWVC